MVNIGRSSTGCGTCRKRKIKCDEGKPGCKRCAQIRKPCPGYPLQIQLQIRAGQEGTSPASGHRHQLPGPVSAPIQPTDLVRKPTSFNTAPVTSSQIKVKEEGGAHQVDLQKLTSSQQAISPHLRYDIQHQSLCFFLNLFCFQAGRLYAFPVLDFLPEMLTTAKHSSCIQKAAMAVSRMTLADRYSGKDVRLQTGREYGQALSLTNATIRDTRTSIEDETVLAVWLLGLYEMISVLLTHGRTSSDARTLEEEWQAHFLHVRGAMNLLRLRGLSQFTTARGEKIFRIFKAAIQMRLFILSSVHTKDFDNLEVDVYKDEHEFVPSQTANRASAYFHHVARLLEKVQHFLTQDPEQLSQDGANADIFVQRGEALDRGMTDWSKDEPGWDMMRVHTTTAGTMWALYPSHALHYFYSFWVFLYWLRFLAARFKLYEGLIELLKLDTERFMSGPRIWPAGTDARMAKYQSCLRETATELIGLTAYALGDVTPTGDFNSSVSGYHPRKGFQEINVVAAMQLILPLKMLQRSTYLTAIQKGAVDLAISHIADGFRRQPLEFL